MMASLFKRTYRDGKGKQVKTTNWYVDVQLPSGARLRVPGYADKGATEELGRKLRRLAEIREARDVLPHELRQWLDGLSLELREKLAKAGLLDEESMQSAKPLSQHLEDYRQSLKDNRRTEHHVTITCARIQTVLDGIRAQLITDLNAAAVTRYLATRRAKIRADGGLSVKSSNHYLGAIKGFCNWLVIEQRTPKNPLAHLAKLNAETDRRHVRRAFEFDELTQLLTVTRSGPERFGMSGEQRYWLYWLAASTGLRSNEIRTLTRQSFELEGADPSVTVEASFAKNRHTRTVPLRGDVLPQLTAFIGCKLPTAAVFTLPLGTCIVRMLREDMAAARGEWLGDARTVEERQERKRSSFLNQHDDAGRVLDFHSFRVTFATMLVASGADVKTAQEGLGHSSPMMTLGVYAKVLKGSLRGAIEKLPSIAANPATALANGTDGQSVPLAQTVTITGTPTGTNRMRREGVSVRRSSSPRGQNAPAKEYETGRKQGEYECSGMAGDEQDCALAETGGGGIRTHE